MSLLWALSYHPESASIDTGGKHDSEPYPMPWCTFGLHTWTEIPHMSDLWNFKNTHSSQTECQTKHCGPNVYNHAHSSHPPSSWKGLLVVPVERNDWLNMLQILCYKLLVLWVLYICCPVCFVFEGHEKDVCVSLVQRLYAAICSPFKGLHHFDLAEKGFQTGHELLFWGFRGIWLEFEKDNVSDHCRTCKGNTRINSWAKMIGKMIWIILVSCERGGDSRILL